MAEVQPASFWNDIVVIIGIALILLPVLAWNTVFQDFFHRVLKIENPLWYAVIVTLVVALILWGFRALFKRSV